MTERAAKLFASVLLVLMFLVPAFAEAQAWQMGGSASSNLDEVGYDVALDTSNLNFYVAGYSEGPSPQLSGLGNYGARDGYVAKYGPGGGLIWAFNIGGTGDDGIRDVEVGPAGDVFVTGYFEDSIEFQGTSGPSLKLGSKGGKDVFVARYNTLGQLVWAVDGGGPGEDEGWGISVNPNAVVACGFFTGAAQFGLYNTIYNHPSANFFVISYSLVGTTNWMVDGGSDSTDIARAVVADADTSFVIGDFLGDSIRLFDNAGLQQSAIGNASPGNSEDIFVSGIVNAGGFHAWSRKISSANRDFGNGITSDKSGIYCTGGVSQNATFPSGGTTLPQNNRDIFVSSHLKSNGDTEWLKIERTSGNFPGDGQDIDTDHEGNIYVTGSMAGNTNFSGTLVVPPSFLASPWLVKYPNSGGFPDYVLTGGGGGIDITYGVTAGGCGRAFITGRLGGASAQYDTITLPGSFANDNMFWVGTDSSNPDIPFGPDSTYCGTINDTLDAGPAGSVFNWNTGETTRKINITNTGTYYVDVLSPFGCFNSDTIQVSQGGASVNLGNDTTLCSQANFTLDAANPGATYLWSDGSTNQTLTVSASGQYYVDVTDTNGCLASDTIVLTFASNPFIPLFPDSTICQGDTLVLDADNPGSTYLWSTGATTQTIPAFSSGQYYVDVTNASGCQGSDTIQVTVAPVPLVNLGNDTLLCTGQSLTLNAGNPSSSYLWSTTANSQTITVTSAGQYSVDVTDTNNCLGNDTIDITFFAGTVLNLGPDTTICPDDTLILDAGTGWSSILWNSGASTQTLLVDSAGTYYVDVTDANGCAQSDTIHVSEFSVPVVYIGPDTILCPGDTFDLDPGIPPPQVTSFLWSTGATSKEIYVTTAGTYSVRIVSLDGCILTDTATISIGSAVFLGNDTTICSGQSLTLDAGSSGSTYLWSTGATTQTISVTGTGQYYVDVTNPGGCNSSDTINVTVAPNLTVNLGNDTTICSGQNLTLDAGNPGSTYLWSTTAATQTITVSATGQYYVDVTDANGCTGVDTINVTVSPNLTVNLGNDTTICSGQNLTLDAGNPGSTYLWSTTAATQTITVSATGQYYVDVTDANGCTGVDTINVTVAPNLAVNLGNDTTICSGQNLTLDAGNPGSTFLWSTTAATQTITVSATGQYYVDVTDANGCTGVDTINVTVAPNLTVNLGNDTTICSGQNLTLDAGNPGSTYLWSTTAATQTITVSATGQYYVDVTDANGCTGVDTINVTVSPNLTVNLGNDTTICSGQNLTLDAGNPGSTYLWSTTAATQTITVSATGQYYVDVTDANGCTGVDTINVTVAPNLTVNLGNDTTICSGQNLTLDAGNPGSTFLWSTTAATQTITVSATGQYYVDVTDANGCTGVDTINVTVSPNLTVNLGNDTTICSGQNLTLDAGNPGSTYLWSTTAATQTITVSATGQYYVDVTDANGCTGVDTINVTVAPNLTVNLGNDTTICSGQNLTLDAGNPGSTYLWSTTAATQTITVSATGQYYVDVTDANGCTGVDTINVTVAPNLTVNLGNDTTICSGQNLTLDAGNPGSTYLWSTTAATQTITVSATGQYFVDVTDANGCTGVDTINVTVSPNLTVNLGNDTTICSGQNLTLDAGNPGSTYLWSTTAVTQTITVSATGQYYVDVTDANGCTGVDTINVIVAPTPTINLGADTVLCGGASLTLDAGNPGSAYNWNTSASTQTILVSTPGTYWVELVDTNQCFGTDTINVGAVSALPVDLGQDTVLCSGDSLLLDAGFPGAMYNWSTGAMSQFEWVSGGGNFDVTVTDTNGCSGTDTIGIVLLSLPIVNLGNDTTLCQEDSLLADPGLALGLYQWSTGDSSATIGISMAGTYSLVYTDTNGCSASDTLLVQYSTYSPDLGADTASCPGDSVALSPGPGFQSLTWSTGSTAPSLFVSVPGTYWVNSVDSFGCAGSDTLEFTLNPQATVDLGADTAFCAPGQFSLDAGVGFTSYLWSDNSTSSSLSVSQSGTYWVRVENAFSCEGSDTVEVRVHALPQVSLTGLLPEYCEGDSLTQLIYAPGGTGGVLSGPGVIGEFFDPALAGAGGPYQVLYSYVDSNGCASVDSVSTTVLASPPLANAGPDQVLANGSQTVLAANAAGTALGSWTVISGGGSLSSAADPLAQLSNLPGGETILAWTIDGGACGLSSDSVTIFVDVLFIPEAISPNGDNLNEAFVIQGVGPADQVKLTVFNRWGTLVYEAEPYANDWSGENLSGESLSDDTYFYILELNGEVRQGYVVVKR